MRRLAVSLVVVAVAACAGSLALPERARTGGTAADLDKSLTVTFEAGTGTVTSSPAGINCPPACAASFPVGTSVTLTATPAGGFRFDAWEQGSPCTVQPTVPNQCRVAVTTDWRVGVLFRPAGTLQVFPNGSGAVSVAPPGIDLATGVQLSRCSLAQHPEGCRLAYAPGTAVTATAEPASGRTFAGWSAVGCAPGPCAVKVEAGENSLVANFNPLQLIVVVSGSGRVTSSPAGIDCTDQGGQCAVDGPLGKPFVLSATGPHEWRFGCEPEGGDVRAARCKATVAGLPTEAGISFNGAGGPEPPDRIAIRLDVAKNKDAPTVRGRKINCGATCTATYKFGDMEELMPVDAPGAAFVEWLNGCGTTRVCRFPVGPITSMQAVFGPPFAASIVRLRVDSQRRVVARIQVNRPAVVSLELGRNGRHVAKTHKALKPGQTTVRVNVPRRARGRFTVVAVVKSGAVEKRLTRSITVRR